MLLPFPLMVVIISTRERLTEEGEGNRACSSYPEGLTVSQLLQEESDPYGILSELSRGTMLRMESLEPECV